MATTSGYVDYAADPMIDYEVQLPEYVLKLRGLPWTCTTKEILEFFNGININNGSNGVHLITTTEGRSSGEAFVEVSTDHDVQEGLNRNRNSIGHRYIEVFKVKRAEMEWIVRKNRQGSAFGNRGNAAYGAAVAAVRAMVVNDGVPIAAEIPSLMAMGQLDCDLFVRLRGLPYECTKDDIYQFFKGLEVAQSGVHLFDDGTGRNTGEAYVQFTTKEETEKALLYDRQCIGHRYIEVFRVNQSEFSMMDNLAPRNRRPPRGYRPSPYDRPPPPSMRAGRFAGSGRPIRYCGKKEVYDEDNWNTYANQVGGWSSGNGSAALQPPPPPPGPPPLIPGLKRRSERERSAPSSFGNVDNSRNWVLMRGLPFRATEEDIMEFFEPIVPVAIHIIFDASHRPSGNAKVVFSSAEDVTVAMGKHKNLMEHRYIELFPGGG